MEVCRFLRGDNGVFQAMSKPQQVEAARFNQTQVSPNSGDICKIAKSIEIAKVYFEANSEFRNMEKVWLTMEEKLIMWCEQKDDVFDMLQYIKERIRWEVVTEHVLEEWAKLLKASIYSDEDVEDITETANDILEAIFTQERNYYLRLQGGVSYLLKGCQVAETKPIYDKWKVLRSYYCKVFPDFSFSLSDEVWTYLQNIGEVEAEVEAKEKDTPQVLQAKEAFRLKYDGYFDNIETFFELLKTIKPRPLKTIYKTNKLEKVSGVKEFFNDCEKIVPERKEAKERGWNEENFKRLEPLKVDK